MGWVRVDDHFNEHVKHAQVGPIGWGYWLAGLAYCNRNLTDGFIPRSVARSLADFQVIDGEDVVWTLATHSGHAGSDMSAEWVIDLLVVAGLWNQVPGGYEVHDYGEYQPTRAEYEEMRRQKQAAGQAGGRASAQARAQANGRAPAQAESNPTPTPTPKATSTSRAKARG